MIMPCPLPNDSLLQRHANAGAYTDCYTTDIKQAVSQTRFVEAFYSTRVFAIERLILKWAINKGSTLSDIQQLAAGATNTFAAWTVEARTSNQLLLADFKGRTRSWLMTQPLSENGTSATRLFFGSAFMPRTDPATGQRLSGAGFGSLLWFHKFYSRVLLAAAASRLRLQRVR